MIYKKQKKVNLQKIFKKKCSFYGCNKPAVSLLNKKFFCNFHFNLLKKGGNSRTRFKNKIEQIKKIKKEKIKWHK